MDTSPGSTLLLTSSFIPSYNWWFASLSGKTHFQKYAQKVDLLNLRIISGNLHSCISVTGEAIPFLHIFSQPRMRYIVIIQDSPRWIACTAVWGVNNFFFISHSRAPTFLHGFRVGSFSFLLYCFLVIGCESIFYIFFLYPVTNLFYSITMYPVTHFFSMKFPVRLHTFAMFHVLFYFLTESKRLSCRSPIACFK